MITDRHLKEILGKIFPIILIIVWLIRFPRKSLNSIAYIILIIFLFIIELHKVIKSIIYIILDMGFIRISKKIFSIQNRVHLSEYQLIIKSKEYTSTIKILNNKEKIICPKWIKDFIIFKDSMLPVNILKNKEKFLLKIKKLEWAHIIKQINLLSKTWMETDLNIPKKMVLKIMLKI